MEYFDFDGTCAGLVNNPSSAYMDGNAAFAFAVKLACNDEFRFLTGRGKEDFNALLYNKGQNVVEAPNAQEVRDAKESKLKTASRTPTETSMDLAVLPAACLKMRYCL